MESETASSADEQVSGGGGGGGGGASAGADTRGKHRILAELKRVEQEMKFLEVSLNLFFFGYFKCYRQPTLLAYEMCRLGLVLWESSFLP